MKLQRLVSKESDEEAKRYDFEIMIDREAGGKFSLQKQLCVINNFSMSIDH